MRLNSFLLIFILLALVACEPAEDVIEVTRPVVVTEEVVVTETAVPTQPPATPALEPTRLLVKEVAVTETAVPSATPTLVAEPIPKLTPESLITFEQPPDGSPYPIVPISNTNTSNYRLTSPDPTMLIQTLGLTMKETCNYDRAGYSFNYDERDIFHMLKYEYDQLEEVDLQSAIWLVQNTELCLDQGWSLFPPAIIPQALEAGVLQFLNQNSIKFEPVVQTMPEFNFRAIPIDYDERYTEWLIEVTFVRYDLRIFVPVYEDDLGNYQLIPNEFTSQPVRTLFAREVKSDIDLTGDGVNEIIVVWQMNGSTATSHPGYIEVFSWDTDSMHLLSKLFIGDHIFNAAFDTKYAIADYTNDLIPDIEIIKPHYDYDFANCDWVEKHLYSWQGTEVISSIEFLKNPNITECASSDIEFAGTSLLTDSNWEREDAFVFTDLSDFAYGESDENLRRFILNYAPSMQLQILSENDLPYFQEIIQRTLVRMEEEEIYIQQSHLLYLLGLNYELSGDAENAITTYLSLIQQAPTSPWSWLAWARLEPVN